LTAATKTASGGPMSRCNLFHGLKRERRFRGAGTSTNDRGRKIAFKIAD